MSIDFTEKRTALDELAAILLGDQIPTAGEWRGADVVVTTRPPIPKTGGFYPDPRYVVTPNANQVSWLFKQLRDVFSDFYDSASKIEFFGRLANATSRYQQDCNRNENRRHLMFAVLHEAFAILDEMENGTFEYLLIANGNEIAGDSIETRGFVGVAETKNFFALRGFDLDGRK